MSDQKKFKSQKKLNLKKKKIIKTSLTQRGYALTKTEFGFKDINRCKKELTVSPFVNNNFAAQAKPFPIYLESNKKLYLPKYYGLETFGEPDHVKAKKGEDISINFIGTLREKQLKAFNAFNASCTKGSYVKYSRGGIISLPCGFGKTILALYAISKLAKKTLVIVHKEFLINQWKERIAQFLPDARVGTIQAKIIDIDNKDIVIGMLQSLSMKEYPQDTFQSFGFTIVDECHHISAEVFSRSLPKVNSQYSLGLSATPKRKDGLSKVFYWFLGPMIYQISKRDDFPVDINIAEYNCQDETYCKEEIVGFKRQICVPRMINNVTGYYRRLELVVEIIKKLLIQDKKILVLSDRRAHLTNIYTAVTDREISDIGYYVGGMKQKDLKLSEEKSIILGTYSMSSEGMDIPDIDAIIFASPKSDIIQSIGRMLRKKHDNPPIAWDIVDNFSIFPRQYIKRRTYYRKMKYNINIYEINDNPNISIESMVSQLDRLPKKDCKKKRQKKKEPELAEYMFIKEEN